MNCNRVFATLLLFLSSQLATANLLIKAKTFALDTVTEWKKTFSAFKLMTKSANSVVIKVKGNIIGSMEVEV